MLFNTLKSKADEEEDETLSLNSKSFEKFLDMFKCFYIFKLKEII